MKKLQTNLQINETESNMQLTSATCNLLIEAIDIANRQVNKQRARYNADSHTAATISDQAMYIEELYNIAQCLSLLIENGEDAIIEFTP